MSHRIAAQILSQLVMKDEIIFDTNLPLSRLVSLSMMGFKFILLIRMEFFYLLLLLFFKFTVSLNTFTAVWCTDVCSI